MSTKQKKRLLIILGDQLDLEAKTLREIDPKRDRIWMAEVSRESTKVWSHKARIAIFLSAMRHFRDELKSNGFKLDYHELQSSPTSLGALLSLTLQDANFSEVWITESGEYDVSEEIRKACAKSNTTLRIFEDESFLISVKDFRHYAAGRSGLRMEFFYRMMRARLGILMDRPKQTPEGGRWNFDSENRGSFGKGGPAEPINHIAFKQDAVTQEVLKLVGNRFSDHPGSLECFDWPVNRKEALKALDYFINHHLQIFGNRQDAMWQGEPFLHHSRLSAALNLKLLRPLEVITRAEEAYRKGRVSLSSAEGFIRQILGWREYVRGVYFMWMPDYIERNRLQAKENLPAFFWNADVPMNCLRQSIGQTLEWGYAHHIQRLMVIGLYCLLLGVEPKQVHEWYLAIYVDAVEWVELPNSLGMSQYADGGIMASKPYIASGKYIQRMSNYCKGCRFDPSKSVGPTACPYTTLYWDFIARHEGWLKKNPRLGMQVKNWSRIPKDTKLEIRVVAEKLKKQGGVPC